MPNYISDDEKYQIEFDKDDFREIKVVKLGTKHLVLPDKGIKEIKAKLDTQNKIYKRIATTDKAGECGYLLVIDKSNGCRDALLYKYVDWMDIDTSEIVTKLTLVI